MSDVMDKIRDTLCEELEKIQKGGTINTALLDQVDKITHSIKSIDTIKAMENSGRYSNTYPDYQERTSYARGGRMRQSSRYGYNSRYSRDDDKEYFINQLHDIMISANDDAVRQDIKHLIKEMEDN